MKFAVLDTSALFTLIEEEAGVEEVESLIQAALEDQYLLFVSVVAVTELFYISVQEQGKAVATERLNLFNDLPIQIVEMTADLIEMIGLIKAHHSVSFADSCIAGLAQSLSAELVHKDPEYEQLAHLITLNTLPYKSKNHT